LFLNSQIRYGDIADGSSNAILVGEMKPESSRLGWASGTNASLGNTGTPIASHSRQLDEEVLLLDAFDPESVAALDAIIQETHNFVSQMVRYIF
jgi:hypothetical protein